MASPLRLLREAGLTRYNLIAFAMLTAVLNGLVTASVGAWLGQTYANFLSRREAVQGLSDLVYERRARAGLVVSSLRRSADLDELRHRKRSYDDVFVEWNKRIQTNILRVRDLVGERSASSFEAVLQEGLVPALTEMDRCLTSGYDLRIAGKDPVPQLEACRFADLHQFSLDCAKGLTDELFQMTRLWLMPLGGSSRWEEAQSDARARAACARSPVSKRS